MVQKKEMVREIGQEELLLPDLLSTAFVANDRIKYYLTLIQAAQQKADHPGIVFTSLREERELAQESDIALDNVIAGSMKRSEGEYYIPMIDELMTSIENDRRNAPSITHGASQDRPISNNEGRD